jgi:kinesin family protein 2/24
MNKKKAGGAAGGGNVVENIKRLEQQREDRRRKLEELKQAKLDRQLQNEALGKLVDPEFDLLIDNHKAKIAPAMNHVSSSQMSLCVCVRKRPLFDKEYQAGEIDCVSASNPKIIVHECKLKVDGITKYIENSEFKFDNVFSEQEGSEDVYEYQIKSLLPALFKNGVVTCFAYGQTGSGKTFTVSATTAVAVKDLFTMAQQNRQLGISFYMSFFEIYGGKVMDLLNGKKKLQILEDRN